MYALSVAIPCSSIYPSLFYSCTALVSFSLPPLPSFPFSLTSEGLLMHQTCLSCIIIKPKYLSKHSPLHTSFGHVLIVIFPFKSPLHLLLLCCLFISPLSFFLSLSFPLSFASRRYSPLERTPYLLHLPLSPHISLSRRLSQLCLKSPSALFLHMAYRLSFVFVKAFYSCSYAYQSAFQMLYSFPSLSFTSSFTFISSLPPLSLLISSLTPSLLHASLIVSPLFPFLFL